MRLKLLVIVLVAAIAVVGLGYYLSHPTPKPVTGEATVPVATNSPAPVEDYAPVHPAQTHVSDPLPTPPAVDVDTNQPQAMSAERADYIRSRVEALGKAAMLHTPESYQTIVTELTNSEKEIRAEALDAAIEHGNRAIIPYLRELAAKTEDPYEKIELMEAADFIALPSITELRQQKRLQAPKSPQDRPPPSTNTLGARLRRVQPQPAPTGENAPP